MPRRDGYYWALWWLSLLVAVFVAITISQYIRSPGHFPMFLAGKTLLFALILAAVIVRRRI